MPRPKKTSNFIEKLESEVETKQSKISMVLGALIILVIGILIFNYFNKKGAFNQGKASLGPAQQSTQTVEDVSPNALPGKYTIKEGDTLYEVAEIYFKDGFRYEEIAKANNLTNADEITAGTVIDIPKLEIKAESTPQPQVIAEAQNNENTGTGGGNSTIWGPRIEGEAYTVVEEDWLSKIAGRAYGDIMAFEKIARANNISDPDHIESGQVLTIPR